MSLVPSSDVPVTPSNLEDMLLQHEAAELHIARQAAEHAISHFHTMFRAGDYNRTDIGDIGIRFTMHVPVLPAALRLSKPQQRRILPLAADLFQGSLNTTWKRCEARLSDSGQTFYVELTVGFDEMDSVSD